MSCGVMESLESQSVFNHSSDPLDRVIPDHYRTFTHKSEKKSALSFNDDPHYSNHINTLTMLLKRLVSTFRRRFSTHNLHGMYRTFTQNITVLSPTFLPCKPESLVYNRKSMHESDQLDSAFTPRTTALSPIKLPFFHACIHRTFTHSTTALSTRNLRGVTVISTMKFADNSLIQLGNLIRKVDLKVDHKKIISLVDVAFFELGKRRRQV